MVGQTPRAAPPPSPVCPMHPHPGRGVLPLKLSDLRCHVSREYVLQSLPQAPLPHGGGLRVEERPGEDDEVGLSSRGSRENCRQARGVLVGGRREWAGSSHHPHGALGHVGLSATHTPGALPRPAARRDKVGVERRRRRCGDSTLARATHLPGRAPSGYAVAMLWARKARPVGFNPRTATTWPGNTENAGTRLRSSATLAPRDLPVEPSSAMDPSLRRPSPSAQMRPTTPTSCCAIAATLTSKRCVSSARGAPSPTGASACTASSASAKSSMRSFTAWARSSGRCLNDPLRRVSQLGRDAAEAAGRWGANPARRAVPGPAAAAVWARAEHPREWPWTF